MDSYLNMIRISNSPELLEPNFRELPPITLESILGQLLPWKPNKNVTLDGYINNVPVPIAPDELEHWQGLMKSFRLTNIQLFDGRLKRLCEDLLKASGEVVTVNLYFTPHHESQCFDFHSDAQDSFIYQLMGEKEWTFLKKDGEYVRETHETQQVLNHYFLEKESFEEERLLLTTGKALKFPYCLLHQARNLQTTPSVHLTFAWQRPSIGGLIHYMMEQLKVGLSTNYFSKIDLEEVLQDLKKIPPSVVQDYFQDFRTQEMLKAKEGRKY
jgi:ribosomal protein L16 Arg81 hydroxylase